MDFEYRTKPIRVEAVQWSLDLDTYDVPHWFWGALDRTHKRTQGKIAKIGDRLQVSTADGTVMADADDWIVFYASTSELRVFNTDQFHKLFERDERASRLRSWKENKKDKAREEYKRSKPSR